MPSLYKWFGFSENSWNVDDHELCNALARICRHLYGNMDLGLDDDKNQGPIPEFMKAEAFRLVSLN